jgi:hypothetical protein
VRSARWLVPLLGMSHLACYSNSTLIRTRDPRDFGVEIQTPRGRKMLLPPGEGTAAAELPKTSPPYSTSMRAPASAMRDETGAVLISCPLCPGAPARTVVPSSGTIVFGESSTVTLDLSDDGLTIHDHESSLTAPLVRRHGGWTTGFTTNHDLFDVDVVTPGRNVIEVRDRRTVDHGTAAGLSVLGFLFDVGGIAAFECAEKSAGTAHSTLLGVGTMMLLAGVPLTLTGLATLMIPSKDEARPLPWASR